MTRCLPLLLALAAAACTPATPPPEPPPGETASASAAPDGSRLDAFHWHLSDAVDAAGTRIDALFASEDRPLQLDFGEGRISVSGGCNRIGGGYAQDGGTLRVGSLASTEMACPDRALMDQDAAAGEHLHGDLAWRIEDGDRPRLHLTGADGARLSFHGEATAETRYGGPGETVFLEIAPERVACDHPLIPDRQCLRVRELEYDERGLRAGEPGPWQPLYEEIEGFEHAPGERNVVRVKRYTRDPVPADASSIVYVHDMTVESEAAR